MSKAKALRALRRFCLDCQGEDIEAVRNCPEISCPLWPFRVRSKKKAQEPPLETEHLLLAQEEQPAQSSLMNLMPAKQLSGEKTVRESSTASSRNLETENSAAQTDLSALRAIRRQCLQCADNRRHVRACDARDTCAVWSYRFGVLPETYLRVKRRLSSNKLLYLIKL